MDRILDAAEALIEETAWEEVTVRDVVARAGASVGSFYARLADKTALLHALDERLYAELKAEVERRVDPERWRGASLEAIVRAMVELTARVFAAGPALHRLLTLIPRLRPDERFRLLGERYRDLIERMGGLLLTRREEIGHPDAERAVRTGVVTAVLMIREAVVFPEGPAGTLNDTGEPPVEEVVSMVMAHLAGKEEQ